MKSKSQIEKRGLKLIEERREVADDLRKLGRIGFTSIMEESEKKTLVLRMIRLDAQIDLLRWILGEEE